MLRLVKVSGVAVAKTIVPDERQREAIEHVRGPMIVLAGAGTGKTTVLIQRIANLVRQGHARPEEILALTYTDNAAEEMRVRVCAELKGSNIEGLQTTTFHAWCHQLLQRRGAAFDVLDDKELWVYLRRRIRDLRLKHFVRAANVSQFLSDLLDFMRRCQDDLVEPKQYAEYVARLERGEIPLPRVAKSKKQAELEDSEILDRCREIARVFGTVEEMLRARNLGTFGHMITRAYGLLKNDPALLAEERSRIRFLLVDEFQDANFAQVEILSLLAGQDANLFIVGDPDQAIYQFRGASSEAFSLFAQHFPGAKLVALDKNRRSLSPILRCAYGIVNENPPVFGDKGSGAGKALSYQRSPLESWRETEAKSNSNGHGDLLAKTPVEIVTWRNKDVEAADVARRIQKKRKELRCEWRRFAVLYRQHNHRYELVTELAERGIPFSIEGLDVLDTAEVRDALACLSAAVNPKDPANLFRVAALPQFGIDPVELKAAMRAVRRDELDLQKVLSKITNGPAVLARVEKAHAEMEPESVTGAEAMNIVIRQFELKRTPPVNAFAEFVQRWQKSAVTETKRAAEFLEYLSYFREAGGVIPLAANKEDGVRLMTVHAAKGLEFGHVVILRGSSTTYFPCSYKEPLVEFPKELRRSQSTLNDKVLCEQEERRLYYVAMTRAEDTLAIYAKQGTGVDTRPTRFLREFMDVGAYRGFWQQREAAAVQDDLFGAAEEERIAIERSNIAAWLLTEPTGNFVTGLSASAIELYEQCPLRFKLERDWNLPRDVPASLHYGAAMHRVLHTFYDAQRYGREISDEDLLENFRADLATAGIADRYQYELYLRQGREQLTQFLSWARASERPDVLHTERRFDLPVAGTKLTGRVDRMDRVGPEGVAIVDYKTGKPKSQDDADESLQLSLYALAAKEAWGLRAEKLIFHNLEDNTTVVTTRNDAELEAAKVRVHKAAENISAMDFHAKPGYQCALCPYRNICPATEKIIHLPQKKNANRAN
jgi:superfamily I DNA/RNA helicase/RecB family exonuclease